MKGEWTLIAVIVLLGACTMLGAATNATGIL
jgi:hypothetical protein